MPKIIELNVGGQCNNNCWSCDSSDRDFLSLESIKAEIERLDPAKQIILRGGEPTIHPDFLSILEYLKSRNFRNVIILSNGRMFRYKEFCSKVISLGFNDFVIKLFSSSSATHDPLTAVDGSFRQTRAGIKNLISKSVSTKAS